MEDRKIYYEVKAEYEGRDGLSYTAKGRMTLFEEFITQALTETEDINSLLTMEKKMLTLFKDTKKIRSITIDIKVSVGYSDAVFLYRYVKDICTLNRLKLSEKNKSNMEYTDKNLTIEEAIKLMKKDFKECKEYLRRTVKDWVEEKMAV